MDRLLSLLSFDKFRREIIRHLLHDSFLKMGQSRPLFVYFCSFLVTISRQTEKSVDGALGI